MKKQFLSFLLLLSLVASVTAQKSQTVSVENLRSTVAFLTSDKLEGRRTGEQGAALTAERIAKMFKKYKLKPAFPNAEKKMRFMQTFPYKQRNEKGEVLENAKTLEGYNVVGILEGTDANLKSEAVVIGAHYDHLGRGGMGSLAVNSTEIHHGADDNASGTSAMLELARKFSEAGNNKRTIIFIAFGGEEEGLLGSKYYVNNAVFPIDKTVAMLNMDMVGRLKDDKLTIGGIGTASEWKSLIETNNKEKSSPDFALQLNEDGFGPSDHSSFYGKQIPVLFFFTGTHLDYHKPTDTAEKINYDGLLKIASYVGEIAKAIDQNPTKPTYKVAASSNQGGRTSFNVTIGVIPGYGDSNDGMMLDGVRDNSPASKAGLKAGDKIVKFAGKDVRNVQDYTKILGELKADTEYEIEVVRGTEKLTLKVIPATRK